MPTGQLQTKGINLECLVSMGKSQTLTLLYWPQLIQQLFMSDQIEIKFSFAKKKNYLENNPRDYVFIN